MWLDRFSTHNTPSASPLPWSRTASPAPARRSSQLQVAPFGGSGQGPRRPGLPSRVSSWTNGSSESTTQGVNPPKISTASLRSQWESHQTTETSTSLDALKALLETGAVATLSSPGHAIPDKYDFGRGGLAAFVQSFTAPQGDPTTAETESPDSLAHFVDLHSSIAACDQVLASVESNLASFEAELASVAVEIETLQARSTLLSTKLQRRREVEALLGPRLESLVVAPHTVRQIVDGPMDDDAWIRALMTAERTLMLIDDGADQTARAIANRDLRPLLSRIRDRAVERTREFVVTQIKAFRVPGENAHGLQQHVLLRQKDAFVYLATQQPQLVKDIAHAYSNTLRWYYQTNFGAYKTALDKLKILVVDKSNTMASEDTKKSAGHGQHDLFNLGRRHDAVLNPSHAMSVTAMNEKPPVHLEVVFRAFNVALLDNASSEFSFLTEFFSQSTFHEVNRMFTYIFEPTFALGQAITRTLTEQTLDGLGVLLCVRLNQHAAFELQRRKVPCMDGYVNGTSMQLWPRFQKIMDVHCESLRKATGAIRGSGGAGSALTLATLTTSSSGGLQSTAPHAVTQRFANFIQGILTLGTDAGDDEPVQRSVGRLRDDFVAFLVKTSRTIADNKKRDRFLFNNYSLIGTIINGVKGKLAVELQEYFSALQSMLDAAGDGVV